MTHLTTLQLSMHSDNALSDAEAVAIAEHVESCALCQRSVAAFREETQHLAAALQADVAGAPEILVVPEFRRPFSLRGFALANLATGLVIWLGQFLWKTLFGELIVNGFSRIASVYLPDIYALATATTLHLLEEGTAMLDAYLGFVITIVVCVTALWLVLLYRKSQGMLCVCVAALMAGTLLMPPPALALELRRDADIITIAESETIDDTLLVAAETVLIEGIVKGDLFAVGERVDISGSVEGNLITFAETVTVRGSVGGLTLGAANSFDLTGATVAGDLWAAGETVGIDRDSSVGGNASIAAESATVDGSVQKDLVAFAESFEVNGVLGQDLEAFTNRLRLLGEARIGGSVRLRSGEDDGFYRAESAQVAGGVERLASPDDVQKRNRFATGEFYLWQIARLIAAFLFGWALLWLVPGLRSLAIGAGSDVLKSAGIGLLTLVSVPIMAVLVALTLVGTPVSIFAIAAWLLALYLSKVIVGAMIGRMLLSETRSLPLTLLLGLVVVIVAVNLPFIGGIINFLLTLVGLGLFVAYLLNAFQSKAL